jgi:hypothetical protein
VRRRAGRDLGDDLLRRGVDHAQRIDAGRGARLAVVAELGIARRLVEVDPAHDRARREVDDDEPEPSRLL